MIPDLHSVDVLPVFPLQRFGRARPCVFDGMRKAALPQNSAVARKNYRMKIGDRVLIF